MAGNTRVPAGPQSWLSEESDANIEEAAEKAVDAGAVVDLPVIEPIDVSQVAAKHAKVFANWVYCTMADALIGILNFCLNYALLFVDSVWAVPATSTCTAANCPQHSSCRTTEVLNKGVLSTPGDDDIKYCTADASEVPSDCSSITSDCTDSSDSPGAKTWPDPVHRQYRLRANSKTVFLGKAAEFRLEQGELEESFCACEPCPVSTYAAQITCCAWTIEARKETHDCTDGDSFGGLGLAGSSTSQVQSRARSNSC